MTLYEILLLVASMLSAIALGAFGYVANRWRGMDSGTVPVIVRPKAVRVLLIGAILALGIFTGTWALNVTMFGLPYVFYAAIIALSYYGIATGHGSYFPGKEDALNEDNELFKFITKRISDPMNQKTRFIGMGLTGLTLTIPVSVLASVFVSPVFLLFAPLGFLKAIAYWIAPISETVGTPDTDEAEKIWGAILCGSLPLIGMFYQLFQL